MDGKTNGVSVFMNPDSNLNTNHWLRGRQTRAHDQLDNPPHPLYRAARIFFCICGIKLFKHTNLVWSFQFSGFLAFLLFSFSFGPYTAIATHVVASNFPLCPQGSFKTREWCLITNSRFWGCFAKAEGQPGAARKMRSRSHINWPELAEAPINRSCYILSSFDSPRSHKSLIWPFWYS